MFSAQRARIDKSTNLSICRFVDLSICRCADAPICRFVDLSICRCADAPICRFVDLSICRCAVRRCAINRSQIYCKVMYIPCKNRHIYDFYMYIPIAVHLFPTFLGLACLEFRGCTFCCFCNTRSGGALVAAICITTGFPPIAVHLLPTFLGLACLNFWT